MKKAKFLLLATIIIIFLATVSSAAVAPLSLELGPDDSNPATPVMGDHMRFWSAITNTGTAPIEGLVAWISLVEIDPGNEQPVDLEDWSAHKAITGAALEPGQSLRTDWPMRLIKGGDYRVVVSATDRGGDSVFTSPTIQFHVRQKPVLQAGRIIPVAAGLPLLIIGLMVLHKTRQQGRRWHESG
ncbi:MAG: hypothetical protein KQI81_06125 [Deltaproteobacteria bacterium]|nr:hypothetical protein [Deltaproteobacteria bacterium]